MRFSKFFAFGDKKQLSVKPPGSSSVHPTGGAAHGREGRSANVRFDKVVELLGAQSEAECLQIFALINNCRKQERLVEDSATSFSISYYGDGEDDGDEEEEEKSPTSRYSPEQAFTITSPRPSGMMPASPRRTFGEDPNSSASPQSINSRGRHSSASDDASSTPLSPERHYLPSPQRRSAKDLSPMGHPLPAPPSPSPSPSAKNAISVAPRKYQSTSVRNSVARQLPLPSSASTRSGIARSAEHVLNRGVSDSVRELDIACRRPSWTSGSSLCKSLSQAVQQAISAKLPRSAGSVSVGEFPTTSSECPYPPRSTPQNSPPKTPPRGNGIYRLTEAPIPGKTPRKSPSLLLRPSAPHITMHTYNQSPPHTPPLSPGAYVDSPSRLSWSQVPRKSCPRKWTRGAKLGQGTFGTVYEGCNQEDGSFFAVKISSREDSSPEIQREVAVLSRLEHPNIVSYLGSSVEDGHLCIFLELVRMGSLESILKKYSRFKDNMTRTYTRQILYGLEYLHEKKTIHRDIKCANILVDVNGQVKLADFGVAKQVEESLASSVKGTPLYMAPEVLMAHGTNYSFPADIWSLGCTVLEMAAGKPPWSDLQGFGFYFKVKNGELPSIPEHTGPECKDFILKCLKFEPQDRPTAKELLQHPFVANVPTPEDVISWSWFSPPVSPSPWASPMRHPSLAQGKLL